MNGEPAKIALFWDKSFLWGIIAYRTLRELGLSFDLLTATDIRDGALTGHDALFVPGGWASDKIVALGESGCERIRDFVRGGGGYLGICGGAGLALSHENGLSLVPVGRMPASVRVPSFSGRISLGQAAPMHPMWTGIADETAFYAWWPGQFSHDGVEGVEVLARYGKPGDDSYVTDLPVLLSVDWEKMEKSYGINLNPMRLTGEPAVIEGRFGEGRVLLSYLHFETPGDDAGNRVFLNILAYLAGGKTVWSPDTHNRDRVAKPADASSKPDVDVSAIVDDLYFSVEDLVMFGMKNFLWCERNDWILLWRRGVRGVEYSTLYAMIRAIADNASLIRRDNGGSIDKLDRLRQLALPFFDDAKELLRLERDAMGRGPINPLKTEDPKIMALREKLFSTSKRCGGLYKEIIELADEILLPLLKAEKA